MLSLFPFNYRVHQKSHGRARCKVIEKGRTFVNSPFKFTRLACWHFCDFKMGVISDKCWWEYSLLSSAHGGPMPFSVPDILLGSIFILKINVALEIVVWLTVIKISQVSYLQIHVPWALISQTLFRLLTRLSRKIKCIKNKSLLFFFQLRNYF